MQRPNVKICKERVVRSEAAAVKGATQLEIVIRVCIRMHYYQVTLGAFGNRPDGNTAERNARWKQR